MAWGTLGIAIFPIILVPFVVSFSMICFHFGAWEASQKSPNPDSTPLWGPGLPQGRSRLGFGSMSGSSWDPSWKPHVTIFRPWTRFGAPRGL